MSGGRSAAGTWVEFRKPRGVVMQRDAAAGGLAGWDAFALGAILLGLVLRGAALVANLPMSLDETMVALNIMERSYGALLQPLDYDQAAPPLFLWAARFVGHLGDGSELVLRLVPFAAGLAALLATWWYARTVYSPEAAAVAVLAVAVSRLLIDYSVELKPYMGDAAIAAALLAAGWHAGASATWGRRGWWWLGLGGVLAMAASFTAPLVLAATGGVVWLRARQARRLPPVLGPLVLLGAGWLGVFVVLYAAVFQGGAAKPYMQEFWTTSFLSGAGSAREATWLLASTLLQPLPGGLASIRMMILLPAALLLIGLAGRGFRWEGVVPPALVIAVVAVVSWLGLYPIHPRLVLFVAPLTLSLLAAGLVAGLRAAVPRARWRALLVGALAVAAVGWQYADTGRRPGRVAWRMSGIRTAVARPDSALVYVLAAGGPKWVYYTTDWQRPDSTRLRWYARELSWGGAAFRDAVRQPGDVTPGSPPLSPPGGERVVVALASGSAHTVGEVPVAGWAEAEVDRLVVLGAPEIWVYAGMHHRRELPAVLEAAAARGFTWTELHRSTQDVVLVLRAASPAPRIP